ncbi:Na+/H+ antiporter NhaA [Mycobacteroides salmoniphilum]|uniref:Na(+)/H(+) antiporter NhaA n=1 Tax=Mycobacteroides salmoniphilum TaxID=404941 RepID=A0A4R8SPV5_9MYCO|nr:Na+/H+ antiporter NhaA [Mycobacteroides salmoniphilum]TEA01082.1 Na(+)/H(+) antiporter NhaA [Mycobacteroides salmoniphilum]
MGLRQRVFTRGSWAESSRVAEILRQETVGGVLLVVAALTALLWANSPWSSWYYRLGAIAVGPERLHLHLTLAGWATDGLLAIFFFVVGVELKREFVAGDLRDPGRAALPIVAAIGGMLVPAAIYLAVNASGGGEAMRGWAIPTATDIAFALAVLAVISTHLPSALRTFLLTLAVVDDLLAVIVIAVFYTDELHWGPLGLALIPLALFTLAVQRRRREWWLLLPLALSAWALVHASGVHATVAGVLLGFAVPVLRRDGRTDVHGMAERFEHRLRPLSAGVAVPVFAFFAAGVTLGGFSGLWQALLDPVALGVVLGLLVGKPIGIFLTTYLLARFTRASLDDDLSWLDIAGVALLAGIGFTVSLLIGELAFGAGSAAEHVKVGVLAGSLTSAAVASVVLRLRNRTYRRIEAKEILDADHDGVPDVFGSAPSDQI